MATAKTTLTVEDTDGNATEVLLRGKDEDFPEPAAATPATESTAIDKGGVPDAAGKGSEDEGKSPSLPANVGSSLTAGQERGGPSPNLLASARDIELHIWVPPMTGEGLRRHYLGLFEDVTPAASVNGGFVGEGWVVIVRSRPARLDSHRHEIVPARTAPNQLGFLVGLLRKEAESQAGPKGRAAAAGFQVLRDALHRLEEKQ